MKSKDTNKQTNKRPKLLEKTEYAGRIRLIYLERCDIAFKRQEWAAVRKKNSQRTKKSS